MRTWKVSAFWPSFEVRVSTSETPVRRTTKLRYHSAPAFKNAFDMRVVAILAAYNEARFIKQSLQHFLRYGVEVVLVDNQSTDAPRDIAAEFHGHGLTKVYTQARSDFDEWEAMLRLKEQIALETDADWFVHADADELRLSPD